MCNPELMQRYAQSQYARGQARAGVSPIPTAGAPSGGPLGPGSGTPVVTSHTNTGGGTPGPAVAPAGNRHPMPRHSAPPGGEPGPAHAPAGGGPKYRPGPARHTMGR